MSLTIPEALEELDTREVTRAEYRKFYRGEQNVELLTASQKKLQAGNTEFAQNFCKKIVDSVTDRIQLKAVTTTVSISGISDVSAREDLENQAATEANIIINKLLDDSDLNIQRVAWRYAVDGDVFIALDKSTNDDGSVNDNPRLTLIKNDSVAILDDENFFIKLSNEHGLLVDTLTGVYAAQLNDDGDWVIDTENPSTDIHIARIRNGENGTLWGHSDLAVALPQQVAINQRVLDTHEVSSNAAWPQRWIVGMGASAVADKLTSRAGAIHGLDGSELELKEFTAASPSNIASFLNDLVEYLSITTGTPLSASGVGAGASGEARRIAQDGLTRRVNQCQQAIGDALAFLLSKALTDTPDNYDIKVGIEWESAEPVAIKDDLEVALMKQSLGVSRHTILAELGYDPDREEYLRASERSEEQSALVRAINTGTETPEQVSVELDEVTGTDA